MVITRFRQRLTTPYAPASGGHSIVFMRYALKTMDELQIHVQTGRYTFFSERSERK